MNAIPAVNTRADSIGLYYLPVTNDRCSPKFFVGEWVIVDPSQRIKFQDYAVLWLKNKDYTIIRVDWDYNRLPFLKRAAIKFIPQCARIFGLPQMHKIIGQLEIVDRCNN